MLRDLAILLEELQQGLTSAISDPALDMRITNAQILLPVDMRIIFRDGGVVLQGDVQRASDDQHWFDGFSRLQIEWQEIPVEEVLL